MVLAALFRAEEIPFMSLILLVLLPILATPCPVVDSVLRPMVRRQEGKKHLLCGLKKVQVTNLSFCCPKGQLGRDNAEQLARGVQTIPLQRVLHAARQR